MAIEFQDIMFSPIFCFKVLGEDGTDRTVCAHGQAIANLSKPLEIMLNRGWKESQTREVTFQGVLADTFVKVCEFAYRGIYNVQPPEKKEKHKELPPVTKEGTSFGSLAANQPTMTGSPQVHLPATPSSPTVHSTGTFGSSTSGSSTIHSAANLWTTTAPKRKAGSQSPAKSVEAPQNDNKTKLDVLRDKFRSQIVGGMVLSFEFAYQQSAFCVGKGYESALMAHARIYLFAVQWQILNLQTLALCRIHSTLRNFVLFDGRIQDVVALIQLCYHGDGATGELPTAEGDELRNVLCHYVACDIKAFKSCPEFIDLMHLGGAFPADLLVYLVEELLTV